MRPYKLISFYLICCFLSSGCTTKDPLFCDEQHPCPSGQRCNAYRTCEPAAPDATPHRDLSVERGAPDLTDSAPPMPNGADCLVDGDCENKICADGVCCESRCEGSCRSCALAGTGGECVLALEGEDPRQDCTGSPAVCAGSCDGHGLCAFPAGATPCAEPVCAAGELTQSRCDGAGQCVEEKLACGGYACDAAGAACRKSCASGAECTGTFQCVAPHCVNQLELGGECGDNDLACDSQHCVDGVCCFADSCELCNVCDLSPSLGQCAPQTDGTPCGPPTCAAGVATIHQCGSGTCDLQTTDCAPYACNPAGTDCLSACGGEADCAADAYCDATQCLPRKVNGLSCGGAQECLSNICTVEGVCCNTACAGECETCAGLSQCTPEPDNTPCGNLTPYCDDRPESSQVKVDQCDGARNCVTEVTATCDPNRCIDQGSGPTCATSCAASSECTSWLCSLIGMGNCIPSVQTCHVVPPGSATCPGDGTLADPFCTIQACLDGPREYVALADGTYPENLVVKSDIYLIATGTTSSATPRAAIVPPAANTTGIDLTGDHTTYIYGVDLNFPEPSIPPSASDPSGPLIYTDNSASLNLYASRIRRGNKAPCLENKNASVYLNDVRIESCAARGVSSENASLTLRDVVFYKNSGTSLYHDGEKLSIHSATFRNNVGVSLQVFDATLMLYRLRAHANDDTVISLSNNTHGLLANVLSYDNDGSTLVMTNNLSPPLILNMTSVGNTGVEISCDETTTIYNSILRDADTLMSSGDCVFNYSAVKGGGGGQYIFTGDPLFDSSSAEPYSLSASSPCIDGGLDNLPNYSIYLTSDAIGNPRHVDVIPGGSVVDIGALERQ